MLGIEMEIAEERLRLVFDSICSNLDSTVSKL